MNIGAAGASSNRTDSTAKETNPSADSAASSPSDDLGSSPVGASEALESCSLQYIKRIFNDYFLLTGHDVLMDGMKSLSPKCDRLKQLYESCFNKIYQECVKQTLLEHRIDWSEVEQNIIDTERDKSYSTKNGKQR
ncbi:Uncharacterized protein TSPI_06752 [Trichinella spiralis]|uniref:Uncharacterized protein n=1 Tax=Trichinella spiralis TaxID=6334 RepID=A0ABR3K6T4_TRISP